MTKNIKTKI